MGKNIETENNKRFNTISALISLNYFVTPIIASIVILSLIKLLNIDIIGIFLKLGVIKNYIEYIHNKNNDVIAVIFSQVSMILSLIISVLLAKKRNDSISKIKTEISKTKLILLGLALGVFMLITSFCVSMIYTALNLNPTSNNTLNVLNLLRNNKIMLLLILVVAPVGEEIAFKYGIFTFFHEIFYDKNKILKTVIPAIISAFIFGIIHDGLYLLPTYFIPSFVGCILYEKTKSLLPCILGHFLANLIATLILI
ncbi:MAG: CPBP family intramembrane metalloprotease [Peptoniphilaceae bacterium]|uniref:CPBP family intramembrane glutamic endopeptidase n=1 Tax=Parvimonas sp. TaxID=1944660 RepID=UPI0025DA1B7F|nr:CPBP family intramembrane glutamic endopeptidase [Parvimonas sp.]MCI5997159.1 CPBP family intramembrane metalloprotease [Parvimonas sp.]MDD7764251.1 CPBP family intramembrane metalloprotease [Peptoniphilaceae bacterium]MDY3051514.1 CPBP family intramembrane glutamic endopeptidase [Parvimonas sp.]